MFRRTNKYLDNEVGIIEVVELGGEGETLHDLVLGLGGELLLGDLAVEHTLILLASLGKSLLVGVDQLDVQAGDLVGHEGDTGTHETGTDDTEVLEVGGGFDSETVEELASQHFLLELRIFWGL